MLGMLEITGAVEKRVYAKGSKSEREAVYLRFDGTHPEIQGEGRFLRRREGNPFRDEELDRLVGKRIRTEGIPIEGQIFLMERWNELDCD